MINRLLLDYVKKISVMDVIEYYDFKLKDGFILCPFHEEKTPSAKIYEETNDGFCFGCRKKFDTIELVKKMEDKTFEDAVNFLYNIFASKIITKNEQKNKVDVSLFIKLNEELRSLFQIVKGDKEKRKKVIKVMETIDLHAEDNVLILKLYQILLLKVGING